MAPPAFFCVCVFKGVGHGRLYSSDLVMKLVEPLKPLKHRLSRLGPLAAQQVAMDSGRRSGRDTVRETRPVDKIHSLTSLRFACHSH